MNLIDTHSHLYVNDFKKDITQVIQDSIASGVSKILLPNMASQYTEDMLALCNNFPENCLNILPS